MVAVVIGTVLQPGGLAGEPYVIAFAGPLSGRDAYVGTEQLDAVELAIATVNAEGGIDGRPVEVLGFDDRNDPALVAETARQIAADDRVLLVIGHHTSDSSLIAAPIYEEARLDAISPSATVDSLTANHPWYFRSVLSNREQGKLAAAYSQHILGHNRASVISATGVYETSLSEAFVAELGVAGTIVQQWEIDLANKEASIAAIVAELQSVAEPGILFLSLAPEDARDLLHGLRRAGLRPPMIGGDALGYTGFELLFAGEPEEIEAPGFFTNGLAITAPLIYDSLGGDALAFSQRYLSVYGVSPEWFGAKAYDAATLAIHALTGVASGDEAASVGAQRARIRDALTATDTNFG